MITARLVGKLGGTDMTTEPIPEQSQTGTSWQTLHTVTVPEGEHLVAMAGEMKTTGIFGGAEIGNMRLGTNPWTVMKSASYQPCGDAAAITGPATTAVQVRSENAGSTVTLRGTVYLIPLE